MQLQLAIPLMKEAFLFCFLFQWSVLSNRVAAFTDADIRESLMGLSISELLRLKHSLLKMKKEACFEESFWKEHEVNHTLEDEPTIAQPKSDDESCTSQNCLKPMAMALTGIPRGLYSGTPQRSHQPWHPQTEEKPSKLTTLFNISITSLAFLAFGGYLFCLIIHAFKSKGVTYLYPMTTAATTAVDGGIRKIKVYRRGRRESKRQQPLEPNYAEFYEVLQALSNTL